MVVWPVDQLMGLKSTQWQWLLATQSIKQNQNLKIVLKIT
jgi:hypothetical protein